MFSRLKALPNELLNMLGTYLSPGSLTALRQTDKTLRSRVAAPPPRNAATIHEVENEPGKKAACLFVCLICHRLRSASQFELRRVARDMLHAFTATSQTMIAHSLPSYNMDPPRYCLSCCVNTGIAGPGVYGPWYYRYLLTHPVKLETGLWDWEHGILCSKCEMAGKLNTDAHDLDPDWCDGCIQAELKRIGSIGEGKQSSKRKHADVDYDDDETSGPKRMRLGDS